MESKWQKLYQQEIENYGGIKAFVSHKIKEKVVLVKYIKKFTPRNGKIIEAGCGTGVISTYLSNLKFETTALDNDENMLSLAKEMAKTFPQKPTFIQKDLLSLNLAENQFDLCFSHGVLEHFSDLEIVQILKNQLRIAKIIIFSVPSNYFKEADKIYGDERFLDIKKWEDLINQSNGLLIKSFCYCFQNIWRKFLYNFLKFGKTPYLGFVIVKK